MCGFAGNVAGLGQVRARCRWSGTACIPFRGVIFDVDPAFNNTNEWWESIPEESRPRKDQPFYHLLAENETSYYVAYVSEQNLVRDDSGEPVDHPEVAEMFGALREGGRYDLDGHLH